MNAFFSSSTSGFGPGGCIDEFGWKSLIFV